MADSINDDAKLSLYIMQLVLFNSLIFLPAIFVCCCLPFCGITTCICYKRKNKSQTYVDKMVFRVVARLFWFLKKKKDQDNTSYFVILDKRAPLYYPYFLLLMTTTIAFYTVYSFLINSFDITICNEPTEDCVEIDVIASLEGALIIFSACVLTFAITTYSLLICTSENYRPVKHTIVIFIQIVGFVTPRILYYIYLFVLEKGSSDDLWSFDSVTKTDKLLTTGYLNVNSQIALGAIFDSIAMSMLTPWFLFVKDDEEMKYRIDNRTSMTLTNNFIIGGISNVQPV